MAMPEHIGDGLKRMAFLEHAGGKAMAQRIIIVLTNSLPRRSITDITRFMERKSK